MAEILHFMQGSSAVVAEAFGRSGLMPFFRFFHMIHSQPDYAKNKKTDADPEKKLQFVRVHIKAVECHHNADYSIHNRMNHAHLFMIFKPPI